MRRSKLEPRHLKLRVTHLNVVAGDPEARPSQSKLRSGRSSFRSEFAKLRASKTKFQLAHSKLQVGRLKPQVGCPKLQVRRFKLRVKRGKLASEALTSMPPVTFGRSNRYTEEADDDSRRSLSFGLSAIGYRLSAIGYRLSLHAIRTLLLAVLLLAPPSLLAQDSHYWTFQYGPSSSLLGGAVIGSVSDVSATFYNPAALSLSDDLAFAVSANVFEISGVTLEDGGGTGVDLGTQRSGLRPSLIAGTIGRNLLGNDVLAYSVLTRARGHPGPRRGVDRLGPGRASVAWPGGVRRRSAVHRTVLRYVGRHELCPRARRMWDWA